MLHDFAQHVRQSQLSIVGRWMAAVRADENIPRARQLDELDLRDHLDGVAAKLSLHLVRAVTVGDESVAEAPQEAIVHGATRSRQQYRVDEVVREIGVLRGAFMEFFSEYLKQTRQIATDEFLRISHLVHRFFDEICSESVTGYVQEREEQSAQSAEELRTLNTTLEKTNRQYEEADSYRRRTLRTVAHELATPVNALGLGVTYLAESETVEERKEAKTLVARTLDHLRTMLDQLFDFSKAEGQLERVHITDFELRPVFDYLVAGFEPLAAAKRLELCRQFDPALGTLRSDETKVQRIAANLLSNAIKYCEVGAVTLNMAALNADTWLLEVIDTGCGIPPEGSRPYLFRVRAPPASRQSARPRPRALHREDPRRAPRRPPFPGKHGWQRQSLPRGTPTIGRAPPRVAGSGKERWVRHRAVFSQSVQRGPPEIRLPQRVRLKPGVAAAATLGLRTADKPRGLRRSDRGFSAYGFSS